MLPYHRAFTLLREVQYNTVKVKTKRDRGVEYINIAAGFDTETTSFYAGEQKAACTYIWMLGIGNGENIYYGRTLYELSEFCDFLVKHFDLGEKRRLPIYVHNLGYDFEFIRTLFSWNPEASFFMDKNAPVRVVTTHGIEFRDSYKLSGLNLDLTAKTLTKYKVKKRVGDLDYDLPRTPETPLTEEELGYCKGDIEVVNAYIQEQIEFYGNVLKIPMTNTGIVRNKTRYNCFNQGAVDPKTGKRKSGGGGAQRFAKTMSRMTLTPDTYAIARQAFAGGFTHANKNKWGVVHENVHSIDFTSSYPAVMVSEKFPMGKFVDYTFKSENDMKYRMKIQACLMLVKFTGIDAKTTQDSYISVSKCLTLEDAVENNGRVDSASELTIAITEIDYSIISMAYEFEDVEFLRVQVAPKNYLPVEIIKTVFELYKGKTVLKGVKGQEREYQLAKGMLNSTYGMCVTDFIKDNHNYDSDTESWVMEPVDSTEAIKQYNESKLRFLYYPWGVWITAYARRNLWSGIIEMGDDYIYSDTDSLKFTNYDAHKDYIEMYNEVITAKIMTMAEETNISLTEEDLIPKTIEGVSKPLGVWDYEGCYSRFKTLGAKKYLVEEDGHLHLTVAGLSPKRGVAYMLKHCSNDNSKVFDMFDDGMYIPADETGKLTHSYLVCEPFSTELTDYLGNKSTVNITTGVHLEPTSFTVNISDKYIELIQSLCENEIYKDITL